MAATRQAPGMDAVFRALADPSRRQLLDSLNHKGGQTLGELCGGLPMSRQSVSKHLGILEEAGLVVARRQGREKIHHLNAAPINAIADRWISHYDRRRAAALADLTTALEQTTMNTPAQAVQAPQFVYATYIKTTPEQLWQALTDPAFTTRYWGVALVSDWQPGSTITWEVAGVTIADPEQVVLVADKPRKLAFTWHTVTPEFGAAVGAAAEEVAAMAAEGRSQVSFEIEALNGMVKLTVTHSGFEEGSTVLAGITDGWPGVVASLKSLLETGEPLDFA